MTEVKNPKWVEKNYSPVNQHRAKNYALVLYPDDCPNDWLDRLKSRLWELVISPLHDKDVNPTGEAKKAHYHILVHSSTWITMNELAKLGKELRGVAAPQKCSNPKGMVRYFTHIDNPEKHQYSQSEIQVFGGYDISDYFKATVSEERETRKELVQFILDNEISELSTLIEYTMFNNEVWDDYVASHTLYINNIIKSVRHRNKSVQNGLN